MTNLMNKGMGWRPDVPDIRDDDYAFRSSLARELISLDSAPVRSIVGWDYSSKRMRTVDEFPVYDQGQTSSCTGQSVDTLISLESGLIPRSRLQLYYYGRRMIGETHNDNGAYIRDVVKGAYKEGAGAEKYWSFHEARVCQKPSREVMESASRHKIKSYHRLVSRQDFISCIANGSPFVIGFMVYADFATSGGIVDKTGMLLYPNNPGHDYGGHAVCVIGYDNDFRNSEWGAKLVADGIDVPNQVYIVRNSWGQHWGRNGNFAVDARYFENTSLADDAWTIRCR